VSITSNSGTSTAARVRAQDLRTEFSGTSSGQFNFSNLHRDVIGDQTPLIGNPSGGTRRGHTSTSAYTSNNEIPFLCTGVSYNGLSTSLTSSTGPSYVTKEVPNQSGQIHASKMRGVMAGLPMSMDHQSSSTTEAFGNQDTTSLSGVTSRTTQGVGANNGTNGSFVDRAGYAIRRAVSSPNSGYNFVDLGTHASAGDIMFISVVTSSGSTPSSKLFYPSWQNSSSAMNTTATQIGSTHILEHKSGSDCFSWIEAKMCSGGERYASVLMNYSGGSFSYFVGLLRTPTTTSANKGASFFSTRISGNSQQTVQLGTIFGQGEVVIVSDMSPFVSSVQYTPTSMGSAFIRGIRSNTTSGGNYTLVGATYDGLSTGNFLKGTTTPNTSEYMYVKSGSQDSNINILRFRLGI